MPARSESTSSVTVDLAGIVIFRPEKELSTLSQKIKLNRRSVVHARKRRLQREARDAGGYDSSLNWIDPRVFPVYRDAKAAEYAARGRRKPEVAP